MQSKGHLQGQIQDLRKGVSNVNRVCVGFRGICFDVLSEMSSSYPLKRNNLDLYDHIGGLSEHGGFREPLETHLDLLLSSTMTLLLVILKYHYESRPMQHTIFTAVKMKIFS